MCKLYNVAQLGRERSAFWVLSIASDLTLQIHAREECHLPVSRPYRVIPPEEMWETFSDMVYKDNF